MSVQLPRVSYHYADVAEGRVFYRQAGGEAPGVPLLLLHGFPSSSHQFRRLIDSLADEFPVIAPDYPGFGQSDPPRGAATFEVLADAVEAFLDAVGLGRAVLYMFDFGAPVGFRLALRRPDLVAGFVVQNGNAYEEGLSAAARDFIASDDPSGLFTLEATRSQYEGGAGDPEAVGPGWTLDQHYLDLPGRNEIQTSLALDYHSNVEQYPQWQEWMRTHRPPALVLWGRNDPFFIPAGAHAYQRDLPDAQVVELDAGHFALEDRLTEAVPLIAEFMRRVNADQDSASGETA